MVHIQEQAQKWLLQGDLLMTNADAVLLESQTLSIGSQLDVDFSHVKNIDTAALALMAAWVRRANAESCEIYFSNVSGSLKSLATLYGVHAFFNIQ